MVARGYNSDGETTTPTALGTTAVKMIAAGVNQTVALVFSPLTQYQVDVTKDLLLITDSASAASSNVCAYYLAHRPMVAGANVLPITCATVEQIDLPTFTNTILASVTNWFATNQTKRPQYIVLFPDIPSRVWTSTNLGGIAVESVAYGLNTGVPGIKPLVTSINMGLLDTTNDCTNYINKVAAFGATNAGGIEISASAGGGL